MVIEKTDFSASHEVKFLSFIGFLVVIVQENLEQKKLNRLNLFCNEQQKTPTTDMNELL
jgi:hypothetical protein